MQPYQWEGLVIASASMIHAFITKNGHFASFVLKTLHSKTLCDTLACTIPAAGVRWGQSRHPP